LSKQPPSAAPAAGASNASPARDQAGKTPPPKEPERTYDWNLGAGVGFGSDGGLRPGGIYAQIAVGTPSFRLALERRISGGLWLMLNGAFYYTSGEGPPYDEASSGPENVRRTLLSTGGVVGVRQAMTSGIVETSVTLGFGLGYTRIDGDPDEPQNFAGSVGPGSSAITYGFVGGLAVERELIEALALRLSASVISLSWDRATIVHETEGEPQDHVKSVTFAVDLIPAIDLRFYF
jgi:hypothetical protein